MLLTIPQAAAMYRMSERTLRWRVRRAGITKTTDDRYPAELLEQIASTSRARPPALVVEPR